MGPFANQSLVSVTLDDLRRLIANAVPESLHLDYKRELKLDDKDSKKEFLRDLTALANSEGGEIVYGIDEDRDAEGKPLGTPKSIDGFAIANRDEFILSIEHIFKDGIDERLPSYQITTVPVSGDNYVLIIRMPQSFRAPHMVTLGGERRYFLRSNTGKQDMSTSQLRDSVLRSAGTLDRVDQFVRSRAAKWKAQNVKGAFWMMHVLPLVPQPSALDVTQPDVIKKLQHIRGPNGGNSGHCIDGFRDWFRNKDGEYSHSIVFRDGRVEFLDQYALGAVRDGQSYFRVGLFDSALSKALSSALTLYSDGMLQLPFCISVSLHGIAGYQIPGEQRRFYHGIESIAEDEVVVEPTVFHVIPTDVMAALHPALDFIWNAFGYPRCDGYGTDGKYKGYR